jgi:hypothetical protein
MRWLHGLRGICSDPSTGPATSRSAGGNPSVLVPSTATEVTGGDEFQGAARSSARDLQTRRHRCGPGPIKGADRPDIGRAAELDRAARHLLARSGATTVCQEASIPAMGLRDGGKWGRLVSYSLRREGAGDRVPWESAARAEKFHLCVGGSVLSVGRWLNSDVSGAKIPGSEDWPVTNRRPRGTGSGNA